MQVSGYQNSETLQVTSGSVTDGYFAKWSIQLCKTAKTYELNTNLSDIQRDGHRFKNVILTKIYNNVGHYNKKLKILNEFAHYFGS